MHSAAVRLFLGGCTASSAVSAPSVAFLTLSLRRRFFKEFSWAFVKPLALAFAFAGAFFFGKAFVKSLEGPVSLGFCFWQAFHCKLPFCQGPFVWISFSHASFCQEGGKLTESNLLSLLMAKA